MFLDTSLQQSFMLLLILAFFIAAKKSLFELIFVRYCTGEFLLFGYCNNFKFLFCKRRAQVINRGIESQTTIGIHQFAKLNNKLYSKLQIRFRLDTLGIILYKPELIILDIFMRFNKLQQFQHIMTDLNCLGGKKELKAKVGDLMQQYEKSKQEQIEYKQQMKQNIMQQILNNRQKNQQNTLAPNYVPQSKSVTNHTNTSDPVLQEPLNIPPLNTSKIMKTNQVQVSNSMHTLSIERNKGEKLDEMKRENNQLAEITFKAKKPYQSVDQESSYNHHHQLQGAKVAKDWQQPQENKSINTISKYALKYQKFMAPKKTEEEPQNQFNLSSFSRSNLMQPKQKNLSYSKLLTQSQKQEKYNENENKNKASSLLIKEEECLEEHNQEPNGVFLTMDESESMTASQLPRNVAYQIKMDRSQDPEQLQLLKQQKIKQFEKKRQERMQQFRRNESQKKVQPPKVRNSTSKKAQKIERYQKQQVLEIPTPKSSAVDRKTSYNKPPKVQVRSQREKSQLIPLQQQESQYQMRQNMSKPYSQMLHNQDQIRKPPLRQNPYMLIEQQPPKALSPFRTPKTLIAQNRSKSGQKSSNIFAGQSGVRQKSGLKLDPKIEPKQRKNSFSRQSNKKLMVNAITHVCFPGELNRKERQKLVQVLQSSEYQFFVFLFKEYSRKIIKGIYTLDYSQSKLQRIYGQKSPQEITANQVQQFYRFDSGSRQFKKVDGCRSFSLAIHAIDLK